MRINKPLLPIKAHYFFFMAAMGPVLPQLQVFGKQLGISSVVMGSVTGLLPFLYLLAKPAFGFLVDHYQKYRKSIFVGLLCVMSGSYALLIFVPPHMATRHEFVDIDCSTFTTCNVTDLNNESHCTGTQRAACTSHCLDSNITNSSVLTLIDTSVREEHQMCFLDNVTDYIEECSVCNFSCQIDTDWNKDCLYRSYSFWSFILLMSIGTIGYNVANSISDAICFDVLGEGAQMGYGKQRVWGTIGFGITALCGGYFVDWYSPGEEKSYTPALVVMIIFTIFDLLSCIKLKLPVMHQSENILKDLCKVMRYKHVSIFIVFAVFAGVVDSFLIYYLFWYLEDLATATGQLQNIKLLEGITVAAETLGGEVIFFSLSGKILERIGYGHCLSLCFVNYALRLGLVSLIPSPWWILPIEFVFQGPTYALCYTTIVAYASAMAPPGTSATMQGVVAGMDDGFGYAVGSFIGGILYRYLGGRTALQCFSALALLCGVVHFALYKALFERDVNQDDNKNVSYKSPGEAIEVTNIAENGDVK